VAWGDNSQGQCNVPTLPAGLTYVEIAATGGGGGYIDGRTAARLSDGTIVVWGNNYAYVQDVPELPAGLTYVEIAAGWAHMVARRSDGSMVAWGQNLQGECNVPPLPQGLLYEQIAAGVEVTAARRSDGSVVAWGNNFNGQCNVPVLPPNVTYVDIATGGYHTLARRSDGVVVTWGYNVSGQCNVPTLPPGLNCVGIAGGSYYTTALFTPVDTALTGTVSMAGVAAQNVSVRFVTQGVTFGPVPTTTSGTYALQVPLGSHGRLVATIAGIDFYHEPGLLTVPADLDVVVSGNLVGKDIHIPRPVMLIHGIFSDPGRWAGTESSMHMSIAARLGSGGLAPRQARITRALVAETDPFTHTLLFDAQTLHQQISGAVGGFRPWLAAYGLQSVPLDMVAHSKGGIVARSYLHHFALPGEIRTLVTLGSPHGGWEPLLSLPVVLNPGNAIAEMHPWNMWGVYPNGSAIAGSCGQTVTNLQGARLCVVGSDVVQIGLFADLTMSAVVGAYLTQALPPQIQTSMGMTAVWMPLPPFYLGMWGDGFITGWSSVVYPLYHGIGVHAIRWAQELHTSLPTAATLETIVLPWLDLP